MFATLRTVRRPRRAGSGSTRSGILNKDEYEAKKAAVESQSEALAALYKALAAGVLTQADYQATRLA